MHLPKFEQMSALSKFEESMVPVKQALTAVQSITAEYAKRRSPIRVPYRHVLASMRLFVSSTISCSTLLARRTPANRKFSACAGNETRL